MSLETSASHEEGRLVSARPPAHTEVSLRRPAGDEIIAPLRSLLKLSLLAALLLGTASQAVNYSLSISHRRCGNRP